MAPVLSGDEADLGCDIVLLINIGCRLNILRKEGAASAAMELQFLNAFGQRAEGAEQFVFLLAREVEKMEGTGDDQTIANCPEKNEAQDRQQDTPGEPAQVSRAAQQNCNIHGNLGNGQQRLGDIED